MVDEFYDRAYQAGRARLNRGIADGIGALGDALHNVFVVLNRIEYQAPWTERLGDPRSS